MQAKQLFSIGALALALASWNVAAQAEGPNSGSGGGQVAPEASAESTTTTIVEVLPGAVQADIWDVKCSGPTTCIGVRACDQDNLDDTYDISIAGYAPASLTKGDRGFLLRGSFGGCAGYVYTCREAGKTGAIKALVTVSQQGGGAGNYALKIDCYNTTVAPAYFFCLRFSSRERYHQEPRTKSKEATAAINISPIGQSS